VRFLFDVSALSSLPCLDAVGGHLAVKNLLQFFGSMWHNLE